MSLRSCAMALAALVLASCATDYGYYDTYPAYDPYYDGPYYGPYYGSGYGYHSHFYDFDDHDDRYFRPDRDVICDRARDVCYDRYGLSYTATKKHFGERDANRAYKKYGDSVVLFSPKDGVTCNRRTETCSKDRWTERIFGDRRSQPARLDPRNILPDREDDDDRVANKRIPVFPQRLDDDDAAFVRLPPARRHNEDEMPTRRMLPGLNERLANDNGDRTRRPPARLQPEDLGLPDMPRFQTPERSGSGSCPRKGCTD